MQNTPQKSVLSSPKSAAELVDMYFLDMRSALLETGAALDRIQRARDTTDIFNDPRLKKIKQAFDILKTGNGNRAEQFLQLFSEPV